MNAPTLPPRLGTAVIALALAGPCGCISPYRAISIHGEDPAHMRENMQDGPEPERFLLAATLVDDLEEAQEFFCHALPERGIVPVILHIENRGPHTVRLHRGSIRLVLKDENGTELKPENPRSMIRENQLQMRWSYFWLPLVVPFFVYREQMRAFNFELARDYREKALPDFVRVIPDDPPFSRVLFFRVPPQLETFLERSTALDVPVEVEALDAGSKLKIGKSARISVGMK